MQYLKQRPEGDYRFRSAEEGQDVLTINVRYRKDAVIRGIYISARYSDIKNTAFGRTESFTVFTGPETFKTTLLTPLARANKKLLDNVAGRIDAIIPELQAACALDRQSTIDVPALLRRAMGIPETKTA
jgi:hypothetical protein